MSNTFKPRRWTGGKIETTHWWWNGASNAWSTDNGSAWGPKPFGILLRYHDIFIRPDAPEPTDPPTDNLEDCSVVDWMVTSWGIAKAAPETAFVRTDMDSGFGSSAVTNITVDYTLPKPGEGIEPCSLDELMTTPNIDIPTELQSLRTRIEVLELKMEGKSPTIRRIYTKTTAIATESSDGIHFDDTVNEVAEFECTCVEGTIDLRLTFDPIFEAQHGRIVVFKIVSPWSDETFVRPWTRGCPVVIETTIAAAKGSFKLEIGRLGSRPHDTLVGDVVMQTPTLEYR